MGEVDITDVEAVLRRIRTQAAAENIRITQHAQQEMVEEDITLDEVLEAIATGQILKTIPSIGEELVVCSTALPRTVVLCISYARRHDQCLSLLQFMNPSHQSG